MGVLAELFSFGDGAKRRVKELLRDPMGGLEQAAGHLRDQGGRPATAREVAEDMDTMQLWQLALDFFNPAGPAAGLAGVIKGKGGNWLAGSVEDALKGLKRGRGGNMSVQRLQELAAGYPPGTQSRIDIETDLIPAATRWESLNSWIEGPLTKYVKTRMASPEDEVRKLAEEGVLHFEPRWGLPDKVVKARQAAGFPVEGVSQAEPAIRWEAVADSAVLSEPAQTYQNFGSSNLGMDWVNKLDPNTPFYRPKDRDITWDLGFPHLTDELNNALNPMSGLPREFQLSPEAVKNMGMEKAVRHVAKINAWRAAQKAEANRALAEKAALVREYTDPAMPNPKGLRWVELKAGDKAPLEGGGVAPFTPGERKALADQLKYEGETMQNCVGGYCDKVLGGESRIFSLRDAKGEPHVTVEVQPDATKLNPLGWWRDAMPPEVAARFPRPTNDLNNAFLKWQDAIRTSPEYRAYVENFVPAQRIEQIKYKQNSTKPVQDYLPFVQDFVRNSPLGGKWADVRDLESAAMRKYLPGMYPDEAVRARILEKYGPPPESGYQYIPDSEFASDIY